MHLLHEPTFVEVKYVPCVIGGLRIVRHHHDGLAVFTVQQREQVENFVRRIPVQVTRRFVADQQRRVRDQRARDGDTLPLAAGEFTGFVAAGPARRSAAPSRHSSVGPRRVSSAQRQFDVALCRQHRQQVVELEHEADFPRAISRAP